METRPMHSFQRFRFVATAIIWSVIVATCAVGAASAASVSNQFRTWLEADLWPEAKAKGVSRKTFDAAFDGVSPNLKLPDLVMPGEKPKPAKKQHQAEFGSLPAAARGPPAMPAR
jgi:membrane-bound lytic murein transglycosylase B